MNIYTLFPLIATIAYIPLLASTAMRRPLQRKHWLFIVFLASAMLWSLTTTIFRSNLFPEYNLFLLKILLVGFTLMAVQFHVFLSSFYPPGKGRWLPFAYVSLAAVIALVALGYLPEGIVVDGRGVHPDYGRGIYVVAGTMLIIAARNFYVLWKALKVSESNPVLHNQLTSLLISLFALVVFSIFTVFPIGTEYPISHLGNIFVALVLSYAVIRHHLVDIRIVLRQWSGWLTLGIIGVACYWLLLGVLHILFGLDLNFTAMAAATTASIAVALLMYKLRNILFTSLGKAFQGPRYDYRQRLFEFANRIQNIFTLQKQGGELLTLLIKAIGCDRAGLLFLDVGSEDFITHTVEPKEDQSPLANLTLRKESPIVDYLTRERRPLTAENLEILPEFLNLWEEEKAEIKASQIELFIPMISRNRLVGILTLGRKHGGRYTLEDLGNLEAVTNQVAVSMEKEYLREQLKEREIELSVINRSSAVITSSLDVHMIYDSFIKELKRVVDVSWAAIALIEGEEVHFLAVSSEIGSPWQVGERIPLKGGGAEWVALHKRVLIEPDLARSSRLVTGKYHRQQGIRSLAYLPLIVRGEAIGYLCVASCQPNAYSQRHVKLLEQLANQIAMPIENSRLYAKAEQMARADELTGLLNRRSLSEQLPNEISRHSRYGGVFSLIILDLDSFKLFNDTYGHLAGDKLLKQIGGIIRSASRESDLSFRYGGDEFAVLLPQTSIGAAIQVAERIRKRAGRELDSGDIPVTVSLGLATWPIDGISSHELVAIADAALYEAKRQGGNRSHRASSSKLTLGDTMSALQPEGGKSDNVSSIYALAGAVDARDHYTGTHSRRVNEYALALAKALNLAPAEISKVSNCALLHDIGKVCISNDILNKPSTLTSAEWDIIRSHPEIGAIIASHAPQLASYMDGILYHHERYDGDGYPKGLKGEEIPLEARILAIADAFAAMTSKRYYSDALPLEKAIAEIKKGAGAQFDPYLTEVFLSIVNSFKLSTAKIMKSEEKV